MAHIIADQTPDVEPLLTPAQVAEMFQVGPRTVSKWARLGLLRSVRTPGGQHRRYPLSAVLAALEDDAVEGAMA